MMKHSRIPGSLAIVAASLLLGSCGQASTLAKPSTKPTAIQLAELVFSDDAQRKDPLPLLVPYRGLMVGIIDWSAYGIFSAATSDKPLSEEDWTAAGLAAVNIIAASTLLTLPGTLEEDVRRLADPKWTEAARELQNASVFVAMAVQRKDRDGLTKMADKLADSCQSCHDRFRFQSQEGVRDYAAGREQTRPLD